MNSKSTAWLVGLALALLAYLYAVEWRQRASADHSKEAVRVLPHFDPASVTSIEVVRSNQVIRAERTGQLWRLVNPPYPAQSTGLQSLLEALSTLQSQGEIPAQEIISKSGGLSPFGLDPPVASVRLGSGTNLIQLRVGSRTLLGDRVYVQPVGASGISMAEASFLQYLPESADKWRDPRLLQPSNVEFDHMAISAGPRSFEFERNATNQTWQMTKPLSTRADPGRVAFLIQQLRTARVVQFVTDDPKADLDPYGLQTPEAGVTLTQGSNVVFQLQFGRSPTNQPSLVLARCLTHTNVVLLPLDLATLLERPYEFFRDQTLLSFRPASVDRIEVQAREPFVVERNAQSNWRIIAPFKGPADPAVMDLFLKDLSRLEIIKFEQDAVADFGPYGLVTPQRRYILQTVVTNGLTVTNQPLLEADFGNAPTNQLDRVYCRRSDETSVYVVRSFDMSHLPDAAWKIRDRRVWNFASSNVVRVTVLQDGEKRELARDPATHSWTKGDPIQDARIEETLHRLGELQVDIWAARGENDARLLGTADGKHQLILDVNEGGKTLQLKLSFGKQPGPGQPPYTAVVLEQDQPVIFRFPAAVWIWVAQNLPILASVNPSP